eukprot:gene367-396_t
MKKSFASLASSPRELYLTFLLKFCESYGYFALSQILVIYLHNEFGCSDVEAGTAYGLWGASIILWGFSTSCFNDQLGVRRSLLLGFTMSALSSLLLGLARSKVMVYITLFALLPIGNCMGMPMLTIAIKRYTTSENRGFAFGLYYAAMNVAALATGPVVDFFNIVLQPGGKWSGNRLVILSNTFIYLTSLFITYFYLRDIKVTDEEEEGRGGKINEEGVELVTVISGPSSPLHELSSTEIPSSSSFSRRKNSEDLENDMSQPNNPLLPNNTSSQLLQQQLHHRVNKVAVLPTVTVQSASSPRVISESHSIRKYSTYEIIVDLARSMTFWRFVVLTLFLINLRTIFRHVDATLPTYLLRCFGPHYPKGMIYSINPFLIIWLTPTVAAMTSHWPHFDMIKYGGYISAISPFFVAFSTSTWAVVMFMVLLSFGEAIWSPRLYDYTMSIAPEGKEASFSALASAPIFAAQVPVGLLSGYLISTYLPEDGSREDGKTLWLIVGLLTLSSPILITVCEKWIREPSKEMVNRTMTADLSSHDNVGTSRLENVTLKSSIEDEDDTVTL